VSQYKEFEKYGVTSVTIRFFLFDAAPEALDEDVIQGSISPFHADGDLALRCRKRFNSQLFSLR
jgi:hypothetical protein